MKLGEFEQRIWELEGIRIVVRGEKNLDVEDYDYKYAAIETWTLTRLLKQHIQGRIGNRPVTVIRGDGEIPNGRVNLRTLRGSYTG